MLTSSIGLSILGAKTLTVGITFSGSGYESGMKVTNTTRVAHENGSVGWFLSASMSDPSNVRPTSKDNWPEKCNDTWLFIFFKTGELTDKITEQQIEHSQIYWVTIFFKQRALIGYTKAYLLHEIPQNHSPILFAGSSVSKPWLEYSDHDTSPMLIE